MRSRDAAFAPRSETFRGSSSTSASSRDQMIAFGPDVQAPRAPRDRGESTCCDGKRGALGQSAAPGVPGVPGVVPGVGGLPDRGVDTEAMATPREFSRRSRSGAARSSSARSSSASPPRRPSVRKRRARRWRASWSGVVLVGSVVVSLGAAFGGDARSTEPERRVVRARVVVASPPGSRGPGTPARPRTRRGAFFLERGRSVEKTHRGRFFSFWHSRRREDGER